MKNIRTLAFVLPQFHPIPENDAWWGKGFTEWTNVTKAKPLFENHYQPQLPTDLGFYDLRLQESIEDQANLAKAYGIHGFCHYHYWFNGQRLLKDPIDKMLSSNRPDMPFMFCWANENWTRRWDGKENEILIEQKYSEDDDIEHIIWLCSNVFNDNRYIKVDGKPVFMIYRQQLFPDIKKTIQVWKKIAVEQFGFPGLYVCIAESFNSRISIEDFGFDAAVEFSPHAVIKNKLNVENTNKGFLKRVRSKKRIVNTVDFRDFKKGVEDCLKRDVKDSKLYRCVTPSWDNTARRGVNGVVAIGSSPELYEEWLTQIIKNFTPFSDQENFVFINAMNEWAEGNHLEPCIKYGLRYLEATKRAVDNQS